MVLTSQPSVYLQPEVRYHAVSIAGLGMINKAVRVAHPLGDLPLAEEGNSQYNTAHEGCDANALGTQPACTESTQGSITQQVHM